MMTLEEFTKIVAIYGSDTEAWPTVVRDDCKALIADSSEARTLIEQQRELDRLMNQIAAPEFPDLEARVLNQELPDRSGSAIDLLMDWLLPQNNFGNMLWRPAMIACLPLVFGILLGNFFSFGVFIAADEYEYWEDELTMLSLTDYSESEF